MKKTDIIVDKHRGRSICLPDPLIDYHGTRDALRMDNGPEIVNGAFTGCRASSGIAIHYLQPGKPNWNAFIERLSTTWPTDVVDSHRFVHIEQVVVINQQRLPNYNECTP